MKKKLQPQTKNFKPHNTIAKPVFAKKSFGQNFLVDDRIVEQIVDELNLQTGETIIEIGAGRGALTVELVASGANVVAIELDKDLISPLQTEFAGKENFKLVEADALAVDFRQLVENSFDATKTDDEKSKIKLAANLPYYISTAILGKIIEQRECFSTLVLMLQREVVERIAAAPGESERGFLTVLIEAYARIEKLFDVPPTAFRPIPKVWSSVLRLDIKETLLVMQSQEHEKLLWQIVSNCFLQKRKTILNNLKSVPPKIAEIIEQKGTANEILELAKIESQRRPETLTLDEWVKLASVIAED